MSTHCPTCLRPQEARSVVSVPLYGQEATVLLFARVAVEKWHAVAISVSPERFQELDHALSNLDSALVHLDRIAEKMVASDETQLPLPLEEKSNGIAD